ncbi:MAG: TonB-dependent receptor domain-containing protein [Luteibaculaceae bacterium]
MKNALLLFGLFFLGFTTAFAQEARLMGVVTDSKTEPVPFANVILQGTSFGAVTDFDGKYSFPLKHGTYNLIVSYVGMVPDTIRAITFKPGEIKTINVKLQEKTQELKEFKVVATRRTNTEAAVMMEVRNAKQIVNAISAEAIDRSQDSDAGEVVRRVPGVTIFGNNFVMIRGLAERYNPVMLHNVFTPSMEADVRSFAFDIIPSNTIDRMLVYKSPAPELPGEFAGGIVKVFTKAIPEQNEWYVSVGTSYRAGSSLQEFRQPARGPRHWLGLNDGFNDLPGGFPENLNRIPNNPTEGELTLTDAGRMLRNNWVPENVNSQLDKSVTLAKSSRGRLGNIEIGNYTGITYSNARTIFDVDLADFNAFDDRTGQSQFIYDFDDRQYTHKVRTGILHNWAFKFNEDHTIEFKNTANFFSTTQYINRLGEHFEFDYIANNHSFEQVYRGIYSTQLLGTHYFNNDQTIVTWVGGYGWSYRDQPDYRRYRMDFNEFRNDFDLFIGFPVSPDYLGRIFTEMRENSYTGNVNLEHNIKINDRKNPLTIKAGLFSEFKDRVFNARNMGYVWGSNNPDLGLLQVSIDSLFHPDNINRQGGIRLGEQTNPSDSYTADNTLYAAYFGVDLPVTNKLTLSTGLRVEHNEQNLNSATISGRPVIVNKPITSFLPSATVTYNYSENSLFRVAYGITVNRPEFRELAPFGFYDFSLNLVKRGTDTLETATIHNFDLRWETYNNKGDMFSVALFYKHFITPIENLFVPGGGSGGIKTFSFGNAASAYSTGIEVEAKKSLEEVFTNKYLKRTGLMFNGSLIRSRVDLGMENLGQSNNRPLWGQSPYIVNAGLFYKDVSKGLAISLLYNVIGERIFLIGFDAYPDIYEMPRNLLDLTITKQLTDKIELNFGISDILNQEFLLLQDANGDGRFDRQNDQRFMSYKMGQVVSMAVKMRF